MVLSLFSPGSDVNWCVYISIVLLYCDRKYLNFNILGHTRHILAMILRVHKLSYHYTLIVISLHICCICDYLITIYASSYHGGLFANLYICLIISFVVTKKW